ncbi:hypothetical protein D3C85_1165530 [compost metagenome]
MQIHRAAAPLLGQRIFHQDQHPPVPLTAQTLLHIVQARQQALGKQRKAFLAMHSDELGTQIHHVIAQDPLDPPLQAVFEPDHRKLLHALKQLQWQRATADRAALVFQYELFEAMGAFFQQVHGQTILEIDIRRLARGALAET